MNCETEIFGALVESAQGKEAYLCSVRCPKQGYVSLHFRIIVPISDGPVAPPTHTNPLSFLEEVRTIGHALKVYSYTEGGVELQKVIMDTLVREYGAGARVEVKAVVTPKLVENLFNLPEVPVEL